MVGGVTLFASHRDDLRVLDPDRWGDEDIIDLETEEKSPEAVERSRVTMIRMAHPEGVHERVGIQHSPRYFGAQMDLPFQILYRRAFFSGIEIARQDKGVRIRPSLGCAGSKGPRFSSANAAKYDPNGCCRNKTPAATLFQSAAPKLQVRRMMFPHPFDPGISGVSDNQKVPSSERMNRVAS